MLPQGCRLKLASCRGFTLIEAVVALVVLAIGASVILQHLRSLVSRAEREQAVALDAMSLLNDSTRLPYWPKTQMQVATHREGSGLYSMRLTATWPGLPAPSVAVSNFSLRDETLPPLEIAYTPGQMFMIERGRNSLVRLGPSLPPPIAATGEIDKGAAIDVLEKDRARRKAEMEAVEKELLTAEPPANKKQTPEGGTPAVPNPPAGDPAKQALEKILESTRGTGAE